MSDKKDLVHWFLEGNDKAIVYRNKESGEELDAE